MKTLDNKRAERLFKLPVRDFFQVELVVGGDSEPYRFGKLSVSYVRSLLKGAKGEFESLGVKFRIHAHRFLEGSFLHSGSSKNSEVSGKMETLRKVVPSLDWTEIVEEEGFEAYLNAREEEKLTSAQEVCLGFAAGSFVQVDLFVGDDTESFRFGKMPEPYSRDLINAARKELKGMKVKVQIRGVAPMQESLLLREPNAASSGIERLRRVNPALDWTVLVTEGFIKNNR